MSTRRKKKEGPLSTYRLDEKFLQKPEPKKGIPGVYEGISPDGTPVIVKEWKRIDAEQDKDLEHIWRHELRQLHRLAGYPGASDCIAHLYDAGFDSKSFYLILSPGQRQPLQYLLNNTLGAEHWLRNPKAPENRYRIWENLKIISLGLETLHSQGLLHRNLDSWAILTSGGIEPDFQLTGFEWSMRIPSIDAPTKRPSATTNKDSFVHDWMMYGLLAADLLGIDKKKLLSTSTPPFEVSEHLTVEETKLLRNIIQITPFTPLNAENIGQRIDGILRTLAAETAKRKAKYHTTFRLGINSSLSEKIRNSSNNEIEIDDTDSQLNFIKNDLDDAPLLIAVKPKGAIDTRILLRGKNILYRLQQYRHPKGATTSWDFAYCERAEDTSPAPVNIIGQIRLEPENLELFNSFQANEKFPRLRGKLLPWDDLIRNFENSSASSSPEQIAHQALTLLQLIEALHATTEMFAVEIMEAPNSAEDNSLDGDATLAIKLREDPNWESLAKALNLEPPETRFTKLIESDGLVPEGWVLAEGRQLGERSTSDTEWHFQRTISRAGHPKSYLFKGTDLPPIHLRDPVIFTASAGRDVQFKRRLKALKALKEHQELLKMLVDPRIRIVESHDKSVEDTEFKKLDAPKQDALKKITSTLPLFLVQGPPGVGKTRLVRDLVQRRFSEEQTSRLLLTAQSNAAIDHLMDELSEILKSEQKNSPLIVRSTKKDSKEPPSKFDIRLQSKVLIQKLAQSQLAKEIPEKLQDSLREMSTSVSQQQRPMGGLVGGRAVEQAHKAFEGLVARAANIVFSTTNSGELERLIEERGQFDWAIIEEAAKATGNELLSPLLLSHRRLMIGDHKQLPAFASDQVIELLTQPEKVQEALKLGEDFIGRSLRGGSTEELLDEIEDDESRLPNLCSEAIRLLNYFESTIEAEFERQKNSRDGRPIAKRLTSQHRMHPTIAGLVSSCFYGDLETDPECKLRFETTSAPFASEDPERLPIMPIVTIDMPYVQASINQQEGDSTPAWHNELEIKAVIEALSLLRTTDSKKPTLAILSPYEQQRRRIELAIQENIHGKLNNLNEFKAPSSNGNFCHTVDSFQGSEADIVIVSLVRNNQHSSARKAFGFLSDPRRMNVLLSRAKWQLILVTSTAFLKTVLSTSKGTREEQKIQFLQKMINYIESSNLSGTAKSIAFDKLMRDKHERS